MALNIARSDSFLMIYGLHTHYVCGVTVCLQVPIIFSVDQSASTSSMESYPGMLKAVQTLRT